MNDNNARIREVTGELLAAGRTPLLYNTDGIWYVGGPLESGAKHGPGVGNWENDHLALRFRAKSRGAYEYEDEEGYHPVVRGRTKLDESKPRSEWEWGDVFKIGGLRKYRLDGEIVVGVYEEEH